MAYTFNPTPAEAATLAQIAQRESGGDYTIFTQLPNSHASGAYQFQPGTWATAAAATGVGGQYANAGDAPAWMQDTNALWLLRTYGPNSTISWAASGPYDTSGGIPGASVQPIIDLGGAAASTPTSDILSSLESAIGIPADSVGSPVTDAVVLAAAVGAVWLVMQA